MDFKTFDEKRVDLVPYVSRYCQEHDNIVVFVGTDSQCKGNKTYFSTIVAMYDKGDGEHGHGAHCISNKWTTRRYRKSEIFDRMMAEATASLEVARFMENSGIPIAYVDIDINENEDAGSQVAFSAAKGWVEAEGFNCRWKNQKDDKKSSSMCTSMADYVARK